MKPDWILVANAAQARLFQQEAGSPMTDNRAGAAAYQARIEPHRKEHLRFASELAEFLEQGAQGARCRRIHVFAASPFLGELTAQLRDATHRLLAGSHDLDLSAVGLSEIEQRVRQVIV